MFHRFIIPFCKYIFNFCIEDLVWGIVTNWSLVKNGLSYILDLVYFCLLYILNLVYACLCNCICYAVKAWQLYIHNISCSSNMTEGWALYLMSDCDAAEAWQLSTQDPATPIMEGMIFFHNYLVFFMIFIGVAVCWLLGYILNKFDEKSNVFSKKFNHNSVIEIIWTLIPAIILIIIAVPSFGLLYSLDELIEPQLTLKIVGHQWYWSYEFADYSILNGSSTLNFDSYMTNEEDLATGSFRLLETDNRIFLPILTHIRLLITSADVLHSWCIPSFGIKMDACPGRLSQVSLFIKRPGTFYGQCSEICGINHGFMPIVINAVSPNFFTSWITYQLQK